MHAPLAPEKRLLLRAANLIRKKGHCQRMMTLKGRFCAVAALHHYSGWDRDVLDEAILRMGFRSIPELANWNDAVNAEEVIERMERAALT